VIHAHVDANRSEGPHRAIRPPVKSIVSGADHNSIFDIREFTHLGKDIEAVLDEQGAGATVDTVRAELVQRIPRMEVFMRALDTGSVMDARRKVDDLIVKRMARRAGS
jgi:hypothetical protein